MTSRMHAFVLILVIAGSLSSDASDLIPPQALVIEGAPPVPSELAQSVAPYSKGRGTNLEAWSETRREVLITTRIGQTMQMHRVRAPGSHSAQLTFFDDDIVERSISCEPPSGRSIVFSKDSGGDENFQIHRLDTRSGAITPVTDGRSRNGPALWARAGKRIIYTSTRRNGRDTDFYLVEPARPASDRLLTRVEGGGWSPLAWSPDDRRILVQQRVAVGENALWVIEASTGAIAPLFSRGSAAASRSYIGGAFSAGGGRIVTTSAAFSEFRELVNADIDSGAVKRLTRHIPWDVIEMDLSTDGRSAAVVTNEAGVYTLHVIDVVTGEEKRLPRLPPGYVTNVRWRPDGNELGFNLDSASSPADVYSLDLTSRTFTRWTRSDTGDLDTSSFSEPGLIRWPSFDGRVITGFLYQPPARFAGRRPILISIHGGPEDQFAPYYLGRWNYVLNELGIALLYPNIRGSSGFGKSFLELDNGLRREDAVRDLGALLDWIATRPDLDPSRVMLTGVSYGGYMTLSAAVAWNDRIRGAIDIVGPSNLVTFLESTAPYRRDLRRVEYGDEREPEVRAFLERIAPLGQAGKIRKPLLVVQGANDPAVPVAEAERIVAAVRRNQTPVWYVLGTDEGHGFSKRRNAEYQFYLTVLFLQQFLLDQEPVVPRPRRLSRRSSPLTGPFPRTALHSCQRHRRGEGKTRGDSEGPRAGRGR